MPDYSVRLNKVNSPLAPLNVQRQSTTFQCVKAANNLPQSLGLLMFAYKIKLEYIRTHVRNV